MGQHPAPDVDDLDGDGLDVGDVDAADDLEDDLEDDDLGPGGRAVASTGRALPSEHERAGGAGREFSLLLLFGGLLGLWAAVSLTLDYFHTLQDPDFVPACDLNPLIGCGVFLASDQSSAFGFPNVLIGLIAFPVVIATGVLLAARVTLPLWYWRGLLAGTVFGIGFVTWLQVQSFTEIGALCPYCVVVWTVMIPVFVHTLARSVQNGAVPAGAGLRSFLVQNRWIITALWYLLVVAAAVLLLWDKWLLVF